MKIICHRGNQNGPNEEKENNPEYINNAINNGYNVEIDVWLIDNKFFLGHDKPQYEITIDYLIDPKKWCHAKNIEALHEMLKNKNIHCFWHQNDDYTITSKGYIWCYPGKKLLKNSICVMPEINNQNVMNCFAICTDYVNYNSTN